MNDKIKLEKLIRNVVIYNKSKGINSIKIPVLSDDYEMWLIEEVLNSLTEELNFIKPLIKQSTVAIDVYIIDSTFTIYSK